MKQKGAKTKQLDTNEIWQEYKRTRSAELRNHLVEHYRDHVRYTSERLKSKLPENVDVNDLMSAGVLGLMDAVEKFDPDRGIRFETYCALRIRGAILDDLRAGDWVPRLVRSKSNLVDRTIRALTAELDRPPGDEEVAECLEMTLEAYRVLQKEVEVRVQVSLDSRWSDGSDDRDMQRLEMLEDKRQRDPHSALERKEVRELAVKGLSEKERIVIVLYYYENLTMKEIGAVLSLSESRVCQIHAQTLELLRQKFSLLGDHLQALE